MPTDQTPEIFQMVVLMVILPMLFVCACQYKLHTWNMAMRAKAIPQLKRKRRKKNRVEHGHTHHADGGVDANGVSSSSSSSSSSNPDLDKMPTHSRETFVTDCYKGPDGRYGFGFACTGGVTSRAGQVADVFGRGAKKPPFSIRITEVAPGSTAEAAGLQVKDYVRAMDGVELFDAMAHSQAKVASYMAQLKHVELELERWLVKTGQLYTASVVQTNMYDPVGFVVDSRTNGRHYVGAVGPGSAAAIAGMKTGDVLISINGTKVSGKPPSAVVALVKAQTSAEYGLYRFDETETAASRQQADTARAAAAEAAAPPPAKVYRADVRRKNKTDPVGFAFDSRADGHHYIFKVQPDSAAASAGLAKDDVIVSVNGIALHGKPAAEVTEIVVREAKALYEIYRLIKTAPTLPGQQYTVELTRPTHDDSLGFALDSRTDGLHYVQAVVKGSPASAANLQAGDCVVSVNGATLAGKSPGECVRRVKQHLTSQYVVYRFTRVEPPGDGQIYSTVLSRRTVKDSAGFAMDSRSNGFHYVKAVAPKSPAEVAGLKPGDVILAVNGVILSGKPLAECLGTLKRDPVAKYEIWRLTETAQAAGESRPTVTDLGEGTVLQD